MPEFKRKSSLFAILLMTGGSLLVGATAHAAPIHEAAGAGDLDGVRWAIRAGAPIDQRTRYSYTALIIAAWSPGATAETIESLVEMGARIDSEDARRRTALSHAAMRGDEAKVRALLNLGADLETTDSEGATPLLLAARQRGAVDRVRALIEFGANVNHMDRNGSTPLIEAIIARDAEIVGALLDAGAVFESEGEEDGTPPLHLASSRGATDIVQALLDAGANIESKNWRGWTPLLEALAGGSAPAVRLLIDRGAALEPAEWSPVTLAIVRGQSEEHIRSLLDDGAAADIDARDELGRTPLMYAAMFDRPAIVKALIDAGANVNTMDQQRQSALFFGAASGPESMKALIDAGADVNAMGQLGLRPIHAAIRSGDPQRVRTLVESGAIIDADSAGSGAGEPMLPLALRISPEMVDTLIALGARIDAGAFAASALHIAAGDLRIPIESMLSLLAAGADVAARDQDNLTPLDHAVRDGDPERVRALLSAGAEPVVDRAITTLELARRRVDGDPSRKPIIALIEEAM